MNEKGFTLIEVMISMMLVGVLAIGFIPILTSQYVNVYKSGNKSEATYKALEKVEKQTSDPESSTKKVGDSTEDVEIKFGNKPVIKTEVKDIEVKGTSTNNEQETELKVGVPIKKVETP